MSIINKKDGRGRPLKNIKVKKGESNISISFKQNQLHTLATLNKIVDSGIIANTSRSKIVVEALNMYIGSVNTSMVEDQIYFKYKTKEFIGPKYFDCFSDILTWELRDKSLIKILNYWSVSSNQLAFILYRYLVNV